MLRNSQNQFTAKHEISGFELAKPTLSPLLSPSPAYNKIPAINLSRLLNTSTSPSVCFLIDCSMAIFCNSLVSTQSIRALAEEFQIFSCKRFFCLAFKDTCRHHKLIVDTDTGTCRTIS